MDEQLLEILRCPQDQSPLSVADGQLVQKINDAIRQGSVSSIGGHRLSRQIDGGLVRQAEDVLYPIVDGIPVMLPDEGLALGPFV